MQPSLQRSKAHSLGDILRDLLKSSAFPKRGPHQEVSTAWNEVAGDQFASSTRVATLRNGILEILVESPTLYHELASFHKARLLAGMKARLPDRVLRDIHFRHV
jgi:predicted nucleic acid-binding Zn ribbon protein